MYYLLPKDGNFILISVRNIANVIKFKSHWSVVSWQMSQKKRNFYFLAS